MDEQFSFLKKMLPLASNAEVSRIAKTIEFQNLIVDFQKNLLQMWTSFTKPVPARDAAAVSAEPKKFTFHELQVGSQPTRSRVPAQPIGSACTTPKMPVLAAPEPTPAPARSALPTAAAPQQPVRTLAAPTLVNAAAQPPAVKPVPAATLVRTQAPRPALRFSIKNARQNEHFEADVLVTTEAATLVLLGIQFPQGMGLNVDCPNRRVSGSPPLSGEFSLPVEYRYVDDPDATVRSGSLAFVVNPDPRTLWKDLASDRNAPFWKEDTAHESATGSHAKIVVARRRGRSHAHKGTCCDDDYFIHVDTEQGWHLAIVADGAGSAKFSRRGSQVATEAAGKYLCEVFYDQRGKDLAKAIEAYGLSFVGALAPAENAIETQQLRKDLFTTLGYAAHKAVQEIRAEAAASRSDLINNVKELSTTLLIGLAKKVGTRWFCAAYWVGDGAVAVYRHNKEVILLGEPDSGEFSGQTRFLSADEVQQDALLRRLRFTCVEDMTGFVLMTDGVSDPKFPSEAQMATVAAWDMLWQDMDAEVHLHQDDEAGKRLLEWLNFWAVGEYDDRTIAIIY
ncbi:MAG: hypothetical protein RJA63_1686 [Pseudomonadota bacterium]